jgi:hypothetical protein
VLFAREVDFEEAAGEMAGGFPANLTAEAGLVTSALDGIEFAKEMEEDGFEEIPIFGPGSEESAEPEFGTFDFINIESSKVALAGGGDVETEPMLSARFEDLRESTTQKLLDVAFTRILAGRVEFAELLADLGIFEMDSLNLVIGAAALDGGPFDDGGRGSAKRVAHVGLLKDFFGTSAGAATDEKLFRGKVFALGAIDDVEQAELDCVGESSWPGGA